MNGKYSAQQIMQNLVADPWYQLSTAAQELFHTNMLYWLATQRPHQATPIWEALGVDSPGSTEYTPIVRREWKHVDLYIDTGMGCRKLVLENKVLAIATSTQLAKYRKELIKVSGFDDDATSWRLLSLLPPTFDPPEPWRSLGYAELLPALDATGVNLSGDEAQLFAGYTRMVRALVGLTDLLDPMRHLDAPMSAFDVDVELLREGRLLSLIRKLQMSRCAEQIGQRLRGRQGEASAQVNAGLTNTQGFVECFTPGPGGRHFGWQAQGSEFRLAVITSPHDPAKRDQRERLVEEKHVDYFDFTLPPQLSELLMPYSGRKPWLGYEPSFVYRYQSLSPAVTWREFIDLGVWFSIRAQEYVDRVTSE